MVGEKRSFGDIGCGSQYSECRHAIGVEAVVKPIRHHGHKPQVPPIIDQGQSRFDTVFVVQWRLIEGEDLLTLAVPITEYATIIAA